MNSTATNKKIAVSLFSGAGGFDLGLKAAGFEVAIAIDNNPIALATYQQNFPNATVLCKDIREVNGEEIRARIQAKYADWDGEIHTVFGGPPCQGFSVAGLQNVEDERNGLVSEFVRLVLELNPLTAIMENVPGIESQKFGCITANLQAVLEEHYFISKWNLNALDYGVPQARKRVFFVASKYGEIMPPQYQPQHTHTVRDAIADLLPVPLIPKQNTQEWYSNWSKGEYAKHLETIFPWIGTATNQITGFAATTHTPEVIKQFINTPPGAREAKSRSKKLEWDGLCVTLRAGSGNRTALRPLHPSEPRVISVREAARLHSYPDWFNFSEGILHAQREIGNSVPPLLAYAVGMKVREYLQCNITDSPIPSEKAESLPRRTPRNLLSLSVSNMTLAQTIRLHHRIQCLNYCDRLRFGDGQLDVLRLMTNGNVSDEQIAPVVTAICAEPMRWADFMMRRFKLGLDPPNPKRALHAATIGGFYIVDGLIPLASYISKIFMTLCCFLRL